jgi:hypothetical protein
LDGGFHREWTPVPEINEANHEGGGWRSGSGFLRQAQRDEVPVRKGQTPTLRQFVEERFLPLNEGNSRTKPKTKEYYCNGWCRLEHQPIADMRMDQIKTPHIETIHVTGSPSTQLRSENVTPYLSHRS